MSNIGHEVHDDDDEEEEEELKLPQWVHAEPVQRLHAQIQTEWGSLQQSSCQTAAARAMWNSVIDDPLALLLAGETHLRRLHDKMNRDRRDNAREVSGVILAVRTLWFDANIQAALHTFNQPPPHHEPQIVLLGAGMDTRAYRLKCLNNSHIFEVDFHEVLQVKIALLQEAAAENKDDQYLRMEAKSLSRVSADIRDTGWVSELHKAGFKLEKNTIWVLEGILYYLFHPQAMQVLNLIADQCALAQTVLLADFMNKPSTAMSSSMFHFYSDWPDELLPSLGFSQVQLSQIGDPDADFGLMSDPLNLFNRLREVPRSLEIHPDDGKPCCRLYLVQASGGPNQTDAAGREHFNVAGGLTGEVSSGARISNSDYSDQLTK